MSEIEKLKAKIFLLELESECLRSVLSEYGHDHTNYVQYNRADTFRQALEALSEKDLK